MPMPDRGRSPMAELPLKATICQGILHEPNMEAALKSLGEMGATDIIPVRTKKAFSFSVRNTKDTQHLQSCAERFVKNSLREVAPTVHEPMDFADAVKLIGEHDVAILAYENQHDPLCTAKALAECKGAESVIVFIGPERGFAPEEVELARQAGAHIVSLGGRIIRAANAGAVLLGMLVYVLELNGG